MAVEVAATAAEKASPRGPGPVRASHEGMAAAGTAVSFDFLLALVAAMAPENTAGMPARGETPKDHPVGPWAAGSGGEYALAGGWPGLQAVQGIIDPTFLPGQVPSAETGSGMVMIPAEQEVPAAGEAFPVQGQAIPGQAGNEGPGSSPSSGEMAAKTDLVVQGLVQPLKGQENTATHPGIAAGTGERPGEGNWFPGGMRPGAEEGGLPTAGDIAGRDLRAVARDSGGDYSFRFRMAVDQVREPGAGPSPTAEITVRQSGEAAAVAPRENAPKGDGQGMGPGFVTQALADAAGDQVLRPVTEGRMAVDGPETGIPGASTAGRNAAGTSGTGPESRNEAHPGDGNDGESPVSAGIGSRPGAAGNTAATLTNIFQGRFLPAVLPHVTSFLRNTTADQTRVTVIKLQLEPENLGEIKIRLAYSKGELTAHFFTSSGLVKDAVECSLPQLREALAQHSVHLGEAAAFVGQEQQGQRWADLGGSGHRYGEMPYGASGEYPGEPVRAVHAGENGGCLDMLI